MPSLLQVAPRDQVIEAGELVASLRSARSTLTLFDDRVIDFIAELARYLRNDKACRHLPAVAALAYEIRSANIARLRSDWMAQHETSPGVRIVPRGVVFHLPPANVGTLFAYSWIFSALAGNANIVRLSSRTSGEDAPAILLAIAAVLENHPSVAATTSFVRYDHDREITAALSTADARVIWGGDQTIKAIREIPMNPLGNELAFADRSSMAAFDAAAVQRLDDGQLVELVRKFYNDSYWFDQLGCSSPRTVFWRGTPDDCKGAQDRFVAELRTRIRSEGYESPVAVVMQKLVRSATMAADDLATGVEWSDPNMVVAHQPSSAGVVRETPGAGMFVFRQIDKLADLAGLVSRRDQTLSVFGFDQEELVRLVDDLNGAGIDRIVPVGSALQFGRYWDGWDLLDAFVRRVALTTVSPGVV